MYIFGLFAKGARGDGGFEEMVVGLGGEETFWRGIEAGFENFRVQGCIRIHRPSPKVSMRCEEILPIFDDVPRYMIRDSDSEDCRSRGIISASRAKDSVVIFQTKVAVDRENQKGEILYKISDFKRC